LRKERKMKCYIVMADNGEEYNENIIERPYRVCRTLEQAKKVVEELEVIPYKDRKHVELNDYIHVPVEAVKHRECGYEWEKEESNWDVYPQFSNVWIEEVEMQWYNEK
jgi:hypothetical protein